LKRRSGARLGVFVVAYLFPGRGFDGVKSGMLEPVAIVQIFVVEQLSKRADVLHLLEPFLYKDAGVVGRHRRTGGFRWRTGGRLSGQLRHAVERLTVG
jgi:hypothetical protein